MEGSQLIMLIQYAHVRFDNNPKVYDYVIPQGMTVKVMDDALVYVSGQPKTVKVVDVSFTSICKTVVKNLAAVVDPDAHRELEIRTQQRNKIEQKIDDRLVVLRKQRDLKEFLKQDSTLAELCVTSALLS